MRKFVFSGPLLLLLSGGAFAIGHYKAPSMTCAAVRAAIEEYGAAIFYLQPFVSGLPHYDRYVKNSQHCQSEETSVRATVPTADTTHCEVQRCVGRRGSRIR